MTDTNRTTATPATATPSCDVHPWCTHGVHHPEEHTCPDPCHTSDSIALDMPSWTMWLSALGDSPTRVVVAGDTGGRPFCFDLSPGGLAALLAGVDSDKVRAAVRSLVDASAS